MAAAPDQLPSSGSSGAVFLSYASQDAEAAGRICEALRSAGVKVWFDQSELRGGDAWDAKIRRWIKDCALFVPIISRHTEERAEGYFRLEWHLAEQRTYLMAADQSFLVPVVIDATDEGSARVPERFRERQWTRLPEGAAPPAFAERVARLLRSEPEPAPSFPSAARPHAAPPTPRRARWSVAIAAALAAAALAILFVDRQAIRSAASSPPVPVSSPAQNGVDALLAQADALKGATKPTREDLDAAGGLIERAKSLDPANGEVWAAEALNDLGYISQAIDRSLERRNKASVEVARALELSPRSFAARLAHALELIDVVDRQTSLAYTLDSADQVRASSPLAEAETILRGLLAESPQNRRVLQALGLVLRYERRFGEAAKVLLQAGDPAEAGWEFLHAGRWADADAAADQAAKLGDVGAVDLKFQVQLYGFEDPAAARRALERLSPDELLDDYAASFALTDYYMLRDPQRMLDIAAAFPRDWIASWYYLEPKAALEGDAYRLAGRTEAARAEWQIALDQVDRRLAAKPDDAHLVLLRGRLRAELGQNRAAAADVRLYDQLHQDLYSSDPFAYDAILLQLGRSDQVLDFLAPGLRRPAGDWNSLQGAARYYPDFDSLRSDPRFQELMREAKPSVAKGL